jgi:hypothetical protein
VQLGAEAAGAPVVEGRVVERAGRGEVRDALDVELVPTPACLRVIEVQRHLVPGAIEEHGQAVCHEGDAAVGPIHYLVSVGN